MSDFLFPVCLLLGCVFIGFGIGLYFVRLWYFVPLRQRVRYLEYLVIPPRRDTEDAVPVCTNTPRPQRPRKYITVDRQPKPEYYQEA